MGIITVAVYSNETNCKNYSVTNMRHRAEVIQASVAHFAALSAGGDAVFANAVDLDRIGLMGHSRGGEAVVTLPEIISVPRGKHPGCPVAGSHQRRRFVGPTRWL